MQENIEIKVEINSNDIENIVKHVIDDSKQDLIFDFKSEIIEEVKDEIVNDVENNLDIDEKISDWMKWNFDLESYITSVNLNDYIDSNVSTEDVESIGRELLWSYGPTTSCQTAAAFTDAISKAIRYLLLNNDYVEYLVRAIERYERSKIKIEAENELKKKHFDEFKEELEKFASHTEASIAEINNFPIQPTNGLI